MNDITELQLTAFFEKLLECQDSSKFNDLSITFQYLLHDYTVQKSNWLEQQKLDIAEKVER